VLDTAGGSLKVINMMRCSGKSYRSEGTKLTIYNRISIFGGDEPEENVK